MSQIPPAQLEQAKQALIDASKACLATFDAIENGTVTPEAALALVEANKLLHEVHAVFRLAALRALAAQWGPGNYLEERMAEIDRAERDAHADADRRIR